ncbi:hypothetical protein AVEN_143973-1 [Araneus ventricosus]|uniref:CCHC-type domain-containing protein n=1 Tax=Araneus ventricosus TaxID=182803 RepID=A0A4Y2SKA6_ARAVE|nr:hypothetical protein AVEN_143973-1 [Araneus ventricosus]
MGKKKSGPFNGQHNTPISQRNNFPTFFLIQRKSESKESFHGVSPFLVEKAISESIGELKKLLVRHVRRITTRRVGQLLNTKHLILAFSSEKLPEHIKTGYMRLPVREYIPNPLRCFQCQRFGHSKSSCRGTLTCARCAEVDHDNTTCTAKEKCINCKGDHTSFSRNCFAWKQEKEIISTKIKNQISYAEAKKLVKLKSPEAGNSYASVVKRIPATVSTQWDLADIPSGTNLKPSASTTITSSLVNSESRSSITVSICESSHVTSDLNGFQLVTKLKKDSPTKTNSASNAEKFQNFIQPRLVKFILLLLPKMTRICSQQ